VQYTVEDLIAFYRGFSDVSMMILNLHSKMYKPIMPDEFLKMLQERTQAEVQKGSRQPHNNNNNRQ
jgi:hypothetical protein